MFPDSYRIKVSQLRDGSTTLEYPFKMAVALETVPHPLLGTEHQLQAKRQIVLPDNLTHRFEWRYYQRPEVQPRRGKATERITGRQLRVRKLIAIIFIHYFGCVYQTFKFM
jgi:hypothetical protein